MVKRFKVVLEKEPEHPARREGMLKLIPFRRFGKAEEVAALVTYLASEAAAYITGQVFCIDGGLSI